MILADNFLNLSLVSRQRLLEAREFYAPEAPGAGADAAFDRWTRRLALQGELAGARELGGLADDELARLEAEFVRCQVRPRTDILRHAVPLGVALAAVSVALLALATLAPRMQDAGGLLMALAVGGFVAAFAVLGCGTIKAFSLLQLDLAHGSTGLYVGRLDEQHPWLYKSLALARHPAAQEYREEVLRKRGPLRGLDTVIMRELVRAHEAIELTRFARAVADELQQKPPAMVPSHAERRVVRIPSKSSTG